MILQVTTTQLEETLPFTCSSEIDYYLSRLKERHWTLQPPVGVPAWWPSSVTISWEARTCRLGQQLWQSVQRVSCVPHCFCRAVCSANTCQSESWADYSSSWHWSGRFVLAMAGTSCRLVLQGSIPSPLRFLTCQPKSRKRLNSFSVMKTV